MYSLRYGTTPVVHATGGLDDSLTDVPEYPDSGTGLKFYKYGPEAIIEVIKSALQLFRDSRK
jgi:starch synthase